MLELRQNFEKNKNYLQVILLMTTGTISLWIYFTYLHSYFSLTTIQQYKDLFYKQTLLYPLKSRCIYSIVYFITASAFLPVAAILSLLAGFLFGTLEGTIFVITITALAALINLLIVRYLLRNILVSMYKETFIKFNNTFQKHGISYLLFIRLSGLLPFPIANILLGLTNVSLITYLWTTTIGMIPGSIFFVYMGKQLGSITTIKDILNWQMLLVFAGMGLISLLPILYKKLTTKRELLSIEH